MSVPIFRRDVRTSAPEFIEAYDAARTVSVTLPLEDLCLERDLCRVRLDRLDNNRAKRDERLVLAGQCMGLSDGCYSRACMETFTRSALRKEIKRLKRLRRPGIMLDIAQWAWKQRNPADAEETM